MSQTICENLRLPVKFLEKLPDKNSSHPLKNQKKSRNTYSRVTLIFMGKKHCYRADIIEQMSLLLQKFGEHICVDSVPYKKGLATSEACWTHFHCIY